MLNVLIASKICVPDARIKAGDTPNLTAKTFETLYKANPIFAGQFKTACDSFFAGLNQHHASMRPLLIDRFQIIGHG